MDIIYWNISTDILEDVSKVGATHQPDIIYVILQASLQIHIFMPATPAGAFDTS